MPSIEFGENNTFILLDKALVYFMIAELCNESYESYYNNAKWYAVPCGIVDAYLQASLTFKSYRLVTDFYDEYDQDFYYYVYTIEESPNNEKVCKYLSIAMKDLMETSESPS